MRLVPTLFALPLIFMAASAAADPVAEGAGVLRDRGCLACHTTDGRDSVGPTLLGRFSPDVSEEVVRRALERPGEEVAEGYPAGLMPAFDLPDAEVAAITASLRDMAGRPPEPPRASILQVAAAALAFVVLHLLLSRARVRPRLVARLGVAGFQGLYSVAVGAALVWLAWAWSAAPYVPLWAPAPWTRWVPLLAMPPIVVLWVAGMATPSPTLAGSEGRVRDPRAARGIQAITRHPVNVATALWGVVHLFPNGDLASVLLFGSIAVLGVAGSVHIDRRRATALGQDWEAYAARTSLIPFAAILEGRARLSLAEIGAARIGAGLAVYLLLLAAHQWGVGTSPLPLGGG
ncbi:hypothetical protein L6R50_24985 [Myxococcota bacterium]|nr:hypothetical protein [Myxococcota bacterium]